MTAPIKLYAEPDLNEPRLLTGWPDAGLVGPTVVSYLRDKLRAKRFAEIESYEYSLTPQIVVRDSVIKALEFPKSEFFFWKNALPGGDLILFRGAQPAAKAHEFVNLVLDVAQRFRVNRIYAVGGLYGGISHTEESRVLAVVTKAEMKGLLKDYDLEAGVQYQGPPSMNGLLLGAGVERGIEGIILVAEVPFYIARLPYPLGRYPKSSQAVLRVLLRMLDLDIDLGEMDRLVKRTGDEMGKVYDDLYQKAKKEMSGLVLPFMAPSAGSGRQIDDWQRHRIEEMFREAERDRSKALELQRELYRMGLFHEYEDRFFELFRRGGNDTED